MLRDIRWRVLFALGLTWACQDESPTGPTSRPPRRSRSRSNRSPAGPAVSDGPNRTCPCGVGSVVSGDSTQFSADLVSDNTLRQRAVAI
jgi:hypothetical protein